jgi:predicted ATPase
LPATLLVSPCSSIQVASACFTPLLLRRWRQAKDGEGQVVLLPGEPGIGKSRIVRELRARLEGEPHVHLLYQCSPITRPALYTRSSSSWSAASPTAIPQQQAYLVR